MKMLRKIIKRDFELVDGTPGDGSSPPPDGSPPIEEVTPPAPSPTPPPTTPTPTPPVTEPILPITDDAYIQGVYSDMKNIFSVELINLLFSPIDKYLIDASDIMVNDLGVDITFLKLLLYDDTLALSPNDYPIEQRAYSLGLYKTALFILFYAFLIISKKSISNITKFLN